jgi:Mrp family chromosome partitioning ATPase
MNAILGALLAVAACAVGLVLRERSDDTLKSVEDLQPLALPALGLLRPGTGEPGNRLPAAYYPDSDTADDYRRVGANLGAVLAQHSSMFERKVVLLTSAYPHSGAAVTANLAVVLGAAGYRVLIVDGDLREPTLHQVFSLPNGDGLAAGLLGDSAAIVRRIDIAHGGTTKEAASTGSAARDLPSSNGHTAPYSTVFVASAGSPPSSAGDLLGSPAMRSAIAEWREQYDFVLVQGPPLDRPDAAILATLADAVAVVVQAGGTRAGDLLPLIHQLGGTQSIFAGVILDSDRGEPSPQQEVSAEQLQMKVVARASGSRDG